MGRRRYFVTLLVDLFVSIEATALLSYTSVCYYLDEAAAAKISAILFSRAIVLPFLFPFLIFSKDLNASYPACEVNFPFWNLPFQFVIIQRYALHWKSVLRLKWENAVIPRLGKLQEWFIMYPILLTFCAFFAAFKEFWRIQDEVFSSTRRCWIVHTVRRLVWAMQKRFTSNKDQLLLFPPHLYKIRESDTTVVVSTEVIVSKSFPADNSASFYRYYFKIGFLFPHLCFETKA